MSALHEFEPPRKTPKIVAAAGGSGGPPMELLERVIKIEATLPSLANKSDVDIMRNDMSHLATKAELQELRVAVNNCATKAELQELRVAVNNCATKADLEKLRAEMHAMRGDFHREMNLQTWRLFGASTALVAATYFVATQFGH